MSPGVKQLLTKWWKSSLIVLSSSLQTHKAAQLTWAYWDLHGDTRNVVQSLGRCLQRWPMGLQFSALLRQKIQLFNLNIPGGGGDAFWCLLRYFFSRSHRYEWHLFSPFLTASSIMARYMSRALLSVTIVTCFPSDSSIVAMAKAPGGPSVSSGGLKEKQ